MPEKTRFAASMAEMRKKRKSAGYREILVWVPDEDAHFVRTFARARLIEHIATKDFAEQPEHLALFQDINPSEVDNIDD